MESNDERRLAAIVARAMRQLPSCEREVFVSLQDASATYGDVAKRTGLEVADVERLLAAALVHLADAVDEDARVARLAPDERAR